jgi:hypothetical protein
MRTIYALFAEIIAVPWGEIAIHIAAAVGIMLGLRILGVDPYTAAALNAVFWIVWEVYQGWRDAKGINPFGPGWGWHKRLEMIMPMLAGFAVAVQ